MEQLVSVLQLRSDASSAPLTSGQANITTGSSIATDTIWNTLAMNLSLVDREDLLDLAKTRDLDALKRRL